MSTVVIIGVMLLVILYVVSTVAAIVLAVMNVKLKMIIKKLKPETEYRAANKSN